MGVAIIAKCYVIAVHFNATMSAIGEMSYGGFRAVLPL